MIPEGLVVLVSLTYAAAAVRMSRRGVLAQQLNAIESLASVDTICVDKTGTLTEAALRVAEILPAAGLPRRSLAGVLAPLRRERLGRATSRSQAIADAYPGRARAACWARSRSSSRRRWSAVQLREGTYLLGAPERVPTRRLADRGRAAGAGGACSPSHASDEPLPAQPGEDPPPDAEPLGLVVLAEELRPNVRETVAFLLGQGVEVKVLSGDSPQTVAAIARDVGIPVGASRRAPTSRGSRGAAAIRVGASVVGRISPEGKRDVVQALGRGPLRRDGRRRRQRRARAEELAACDRPGQRRADGAQRLGPRSDRRRLRERPGAGRRRPPGAAQPHSA